MTPLQTALIATSWVFAMLILAADFNDFQRNRVENMSKSEGWHLFILACVVWCIFWPIYTVVIKVTP